VVDEGGVTVRLAAWAVDRPHAADLTVALRERVVRRLAEAGVSMGGAAPVPEPAPVPAPPPIRLTP